FPLLLAISPSRIRIRRVTELFQSSFASKNLRSISSGMSFPLLMSRTSNHHRNGILKCPSGYLCSVHSQRPNVVAGFCTRDAASIGAGDAVPHLLSGCPPTNTATSVRNWAIATYWLSPPLTRHFCDRAFGVPASGHAERLRGLEVDQQLELCRQHNRPA